MDIDTVVGRRVSKVTGEARPVSAECLSLFDGCWPRLPREDDEEGS